MRPIDMILDRLDAVRPAGFGKWSAKCPAHDDHDPSLSIALGDDGRVLVHCHSTIGCAFEAICVALQIDPKDLAGNNGQTRTASRPHIPITKPNRSYSSADEAAAMVKRMVQKQIGPTWHLAMVHQYHDVTGHAVAQVLRFETGGRSDKTFRPIHLNSDGWSIGDPPGSWPLYRLPDLSGKSRVYVCEGEKAADAERSVGLTATTSAHGSKSPHKSDWSVLTGREVVVLPDNDEAGRDFAKRVGMILTGVKPVPVMKVLELPDLPEHGDFVEFIQAREGVDPDDVTKEVNRLADAAPVYEPGGVSAKGDGVKIRATGRTDAGTAMIVIEHAHKVLEAERVRTGNEKDRENFIAKARKKHPELFDNDESCEHLREALLDVAAGKAEIEAIGSPPPPDAVDHLKANPPEVIAEAEAMLADPNLLDRIVKDIAALGVAGEKELAAAIYFVGTSRLLDRPVSSIVQGPTSSGKSYTVENVVRLFPNEFVVHATSITPNALYYMPEGSLIHKFVVGGERCRLQDDAAIEATAAIRQMLSEGRLSKLVTMKVGGVMTTVTIEQDGPISFVETTTQSRIFDEDLNRSLLLNTDEREKQTELIIKTLATRYGGQASIDATSVITRHHAAQRLLEPIPVVVPYADQLGELFDTRRVEARRAFPHTINFIRAVPLLHQRQRQRDVDGRLLATIDDYNVTRWLLNKSMARLLGRRLSDPALRFLERLRGLVADLDAGRGEQDRRTFTTRSIVKVEDHASRMINVWLSELHDAALIDQIQPSKGRKPATWKLGKDEDLNRALDAEDDGLPAVELLNP